MVKRRPKGESAGYRSAEEEIKFHWRPMHQLLMALYRRLSRDLRKAAKKK